jgi:hypothetical protein
MGHTEYASGLWQASTGKHGGAAGGAGEAKREGAAGSAGAGPSGQQAAQGMHGVSEGGRERGCVSPRAAARSGMRVLCAQLLQVQTLLLCMLCFMV